MEKSYRAHVLLLPYPGQGHINPMLHFSRRLISRGIKATLVTSIFIAKSMNLQSSIDSVDLAVISDGFDDGGFGNTVSNDDYLTRLKTEGSRTLSEIIEKHKNSSNPIDGLIYEPFLPWALDVAKDFGLFGASFFTQTAAVDFIYYNIHRKKLSVTDCTSWPVPIPGLPSLEARDMPSAVTVPGAYPANTAMLLNQFSNMDKADCILINTFYQLEKHVVDEMSKVILVLTIGPTIPSKYLDKRIENDDDYGLDLFQLEASIPLNWITNKPPSSVVYVAFGSLSNLSDKQMEELAWGLKRSNYYFIWVVRVTEQSKLPKQVLEDLGDKGIIVNWSPQVKLLEKEAIGCFLSHCGWNSTIEALSLGVPMVGMPQWSDQPTNAKLVEDVWKVGVRVKVNENEIVTSDEIVNCIRKVMESEKGKEMKKNAKKWRDLAIEAVSEGGTSDKNMDEFVSKLISFKSINGQ